MMMLDPAVNMLLIACAMVLFTSAALHKLRSPTHFENVIAAYRILPGKLVPLATRGLPWFELLCAVGMLFNSTRSGAVALAVGLLLTYGIAIAVNLGRGHVDFDCGCAGFGRRRPLAAWMVGRNGAMALLLLALLPSAHTRTLTWTDALTVLGGAIVVVSLYAALDTLLASSAQDTGGRMLARDTDSNQ